MQKVLIALTSLVLLGSQALAAFKIDRKVHRIDQLEAAQTEAKAEDKPMAFLYTDENTTCGLCAGASIKHMDALKRKTVMVYVNSARDWKKLPRIVQEALSDPKIGNYIPRTAVFDAELTKRITVVPYARGREQDKLLKQAKKAISKAMPKSPQTRTTATSLRAARSEPTIAPDEDREMRTWKSNAGAEVRASLVKEASPYLILKKEDGGRLQIRLNMLSEADQKYVKELKEEAGQSDQQNED